jgi:flagellar hook-length control protein FliK
MQTTTLPIQLNNTAAAQRSATSGSNSGSGGSQFGAMLSNEMEQRMAPAPAPAAPKPQAPKPQAAAKPAQPDGGTTPASQAAEAQTGAADAAKDASAAANANAAASSDASEAEDSAAADDAAAAAADPATALLALMASLQKPAQDAATAPADAAGQAFDALSGARGKRSDTAQLASLQAALKTSAKDAGLDATGARTFSATGAPKNPALAAAGADLAGDGKTAATTTTDGADGAINLRTVPGGAVKAELKPEAEFGLQQARDAALLAARSEAAPTAAVAAAQPATLAAVEAAAASAEQLTARVGTNAWENQVGQKVVYMVGSEEQTASLTLNPPDLGPMQVVLSISGDQASVTFSAEQMEVRQALENALPRLREMMSESGIALGNATVNSGMQDNRQAQQDQAARGNNNFGRGNGRDDGVVVGEATVRPARAGGGDRGMVDTFA